MPSVTLLSNHVSQIKIRLYFVLNRDPFSDEYNSGNLLHTLRALEYAKHNTTSFEETSPLFSFPDI